MTKSQRANATVAPADRFDEVASGHRGEIAESFECDANRFLRRGEQGGGLMADAMVEPIAPGRGDIPAGADEREEQAARERGMELLTLVNLQQAQDELAKNLPYGDQRRLEIARALASNPSRH